MIRVGLLIVCLILINGCLAKAQYDFQVTGTAQFKAGVLEFRATLKNIGKTPIIFEHSGNFINVTNHPTCNPTMWKVTGFVGSKAVWDGAVAKAFQPDPQETNPGSVRFPVTCPVVGVRTTVSSNSELVFTRRYERGKIPLKQGTYTFNVYFNLKQRTYNFQTLAITLP